MNIPAALEASDRDRSGDRRIPDPEDHLLRRLLLRDGRLCRSHPSRHHLPRALGLHLAARPADLGRRRPGRRHPPAGGRARPRRARLPDRCCSISAPGSACRASSRRRHAALSRRLCRLHRQSRARARHRPARRLSRRGRHELRAAARPIPTSSDAYIDNGCFHQPSSSRPSRRYYKHANRAYLEWAKRCRLHRPTPSRSSFSSICEPLQKFRLAAQGHGPVSRRPSIARASQTYFDPLPFWYPPFEGEHAGERVPALMPSPSGRWPCIIRGARRMPGCARSPADNWLYMHRERAQRSSASRTATGCGS